MKSFCLFIMVCFLLSSCVKRIDDTDKSCNSNCTIISGRIFSNNKSPVAGGKIALSYRKSSTFSSYTRKIRNTTTNQNGQYELRFYVNDDELGDTAKGYFIINIDKSSFDKNKYLINNEFTSTFENAIYHINRRDTLINVDFYLPQKAMVKINLKDFAPIVADDYFSVKALYPYAWSLNKPNTFLGGSFATGQSTDYTATSTDFTTFIPVAANDTGVIRIQKRKNGVNMYQDYKTFFPETGTREFTFNY